MASPIFTAFHPQGSALALSAGDGRIKVWDAVSGALRNEMVDVAASDPVAAGHLDMDYTCMAWGALPSSGSAKKKKKGVKEKGGAAVVVVGTGSGDVIAWDTALGELKWRTSDSHAGSVKSVSFSKSGQRLYSVGIDGHVCEMDSASGQVLSKFRAAKTPLTCVAVAEDGGSVAVASAEVKLFDLSSQKLIRKFPGHPAPVKALCFTSDGKYVLSSATGESHVVMWHVEGGKSEAAAPVTLSVEHPAVAIDVSGFDRDDDVRRVVAVTEGGVAYVWSAPTVAELASAKPTIIRVEHAGKGSTPFVISARLLENEGAVLVVHGTSVKPHFEKVSLSGQEGLNIALSSSAGGALLPAGDAVTKTGTASAAATVLGPDNAGEATIARPQIDLASAKKKTKKRRAEIEGEEAQPPAQHSEEAGDMEADADDAALTVVPDDEQTLEEKLIALKVIEEGDAKDQNEDGRDKAVVPRADSLQVLLSQALQADDNALLDRCLNVGDEKVISKTIQRLRPIEAAKFLTVAVSKMEGRPQRALSLVPWVRAVLLQHASFVMTNLAMQPVLTSLYQIIETRLSVFRPLLSLSGRLDLIMAQIQKNESHGKEEQQEAAVVYEEEDDEPEAIDVMVDGGSQYELEDEDEDSESEDEDEDDDMGDDDDMDEDEPDIKLNGNGKGMSDGEDEED